MLIVGIVAGIFGIHVGKGEGGVFPYSFLDIAKLGIPHVARTIVILLVFFVSLGYIWYAFDYFLGSRNISDK